MERKSLYDISWQVSEEEYRMGNGYSYSLIAKFNREGFNGLDKLYDKIESPSLLFGSMVDTLLTDGQEEFNKRFIVAEFVSISDTITKIVKFLFDSYGGEYRSMDLIPDNIILEAAKTFDYYKNWKDETRVKDLRNKGNEYYNLLYLSIDKLLVNNADYQDALECVSILRNDPMTKAYFSPNNPFDTDIEKFYQLKFRSSWENMNLKCMVDLLIVDHKNKKIIPCDLKTSYKKEWDFYKSFIDWNYWIQAQLYWYLIKDIISKDEFYKDYELTDYRFIVISRNSKKPLVWEYPDTKVVSDIYYGRNNQYVCRNWRNIVKELNIYLKNKPEYPINIQKINNIITWLNNG